MNQGFESGTMSNRSLVLELFGSATDNKHIISTETNGNELSVKYVYFNNFTSATLVNANFKNAILWTVMFSSANLSNTDLSGADLRSSSLDYANLSNADLSGADLTGADLTGADLTGADLTGIIYDQNTILKCLNHDICVN